MNNLPHIFGLQFSALQTTLKTQGLPAFKAKQIWEWVYGKGVASVTGMSNISKKEQKALPTHINFTPPEIAEEQKSADGTVKWLFTLPDGHQIETVFIPEEKRGTLCVSSQVGCTLNCRFCHTGTQGLSRNLEAWEIVAQVWLAKKRLGEWEKESGKRLVSNLVFMGMGEPLFNWDNVANACKILMDENGLGFGGRKITISSSGMVPNIPKVGEELGANIAISLHAPNDEVRGRIMPINNKWPLAELMQTMRNFPLREHRRVTWEYVMLKGINDQPEHAKELLALIKGIPSFVNLIPFNPWPGSPFECSDTKTIEEFEKIIAKGRVAVAARVTRGQDILAACGQLRGETSKFNTVSLEFPSVVARYGNEKQKLKVTIEGEN